MNKFREAGKIFGGAMQAVKKIDFSVSERNFEALIDFHFSYFAEYAPDADRMYNFGEVVRVGNSKYLIQNQGRIDVDRPPEVNPLCKLFRDSGEYEWVREEFCMVGFVRIYEGVRYVALRNVDDSTPPLNNPQAWERLTE